MRKASQQLIWWCDGTWRLGHTCLHLMMTLTPLMRSWSPWRWSYDPLTYCGLMHLLVMQPTKKPTIEATLETLKKSLMHMVVGDVVFNTLFEVFDAFGTLEFLVKPLMLYWSPWCYEQAQEALILVLIACWWVGVHFDDDDTLTLLKKTTYNVWTSPNSLWHLTLLKFQRG